MVVLKLLTLLILKLLELNDLVTNLSILSKH